MYGIIFEVIQIIVQVKELLIAVKKMLFNIINTYYKWC